MRGPFIGRELTVLADSKSEDVSTVRLRNFEQLNENRPTNNGIDKILHDRADRRIPRCINSQCPAMDRQWAPHHAPDQRAGSHFRGGFPGVLGGA